MWRALAAATAPVSAAAIVIPSAAGVRVWVPIAAEVRS